MKPIIMSAESVRAILGGRKTQTRRVVKPQPRDPRIGFHFSLDGENYAARSEDGMSITCPYTVGQRLWVRETFYVQPGLAPLTERQPLHYAVDVPDRRQVEDYDLRPAIFMPRWASRITLEVTGVRAEYQAEPSDDVPEVNVWVWVVEFRRVE